MMKTLLITNLLAFISFLPKSSVTEAARFPGVTDEKWYDNSLKVLELEKTPTQPPPYHPNPSSPPRLTHPLASRVIEWHDKYLKVVVLERPSRPPPPPPKPSPPPRLTYPLASSEFKNWNENLKVRGEVENEYSIIVRPTHPPPTQPKPAPPQHHVSDDVVYMAST